MVYCCSYEDPVPLYAVVDCCGGGGGGCYCCDQKIGRRGRKGVLMTMMTMLLMVGLRRGCIGLYCFVCIKKKI